MRTFLRGVAVLQIASALGNAFLGAGFVIGVGGGRVSAFELVLVAPVMLAPATLGGILWCLTHWQRPKAPAGPSRGPMRFWLRVLATVEMGAGGMLAVATADQFWIGLLRRGDPIQALVVLFVTLGLIGIGGLLWCALRVAYPEAAAGQK